MAKYGVSLFYSGYIYVEVQAVNETQAIEDAERYANAMPDKDFLNELSSSLARWEEADTTEEIEKETDGKETDQSQR